jgi:hypothetical protein
VTIALQPTEAKPSPWGPFSHLAFAVIWGVSVVSNIGTAMFDTASGWLITSIDPNPMMVSLVQVAVSLPLFLFTLPAGALADVLDSRRLLIAVETAILAVSVVFAGLVSVGLATPTLLLATTFLLGVGGALTSPAWGAIIPMLVPKEELDGATALNGVGFNIGRAVGPALGGLAIAWAGLSVPFWVFAGSNVAIIAGLLWWRAPRRGAGSLPAEHLVNAVRTGARHAANNPDLRATLVRVIAFFPFAIAYLSASVGRSRPDGRWPAVLWRPAGRNRSGHGGRDASAEIGLRPPERGRPSRIDRLQVAVERRYPEEVMANLEDAVPFRRRSHLISNIASTAVELVTIRNSDPGEPPIGPILATVPVLKPERRLTPPQPLPSYKRPHELRAWRVSGSVFNGPSFCFAI